MNRRHEPLDAAERELADLLARDALPGPSSQLDARILAAARAATMPTSRYPHRRRWIAGIGIAASLVLAVGIAWRLRPLPPRAPAASDVPMAEMRTVSALPPTAPVSPPSPAPVADVVSAQTPPPAQVATKPVPAERASAPARDQAPPEPPVAFEQASPVDTTPPPSAPPAPSAQPAFAPAPPAARAYAAPATVETTQPARMKQAENLDKVETAGRIRRDAATEAASVDAAAAADAAANGEAMPSRALLDEEPPATADSPQVRDAWLQRIRDLLSAGETEAARSSLTEFRRRYPKYALPEDLRKLAPP